MNLGALFKEFGGFHYTRDHTVYAIKTPHTKKVKEWLDYGRNLLAIGQFEGAEYAFHKVLEYNPRNRCAYEELANLVHQTGGVDEAISLYQRMIRLFPKRVEFRQSLAVCFTYDRKPVQDFKER